MANLLVSLDGLLIPQEDVGRYDALKGLRASLAALPRPDDGLSPALDAALARYRAAADAPAPTRLWLHAEATDSDHAGVYYDGPYAAGPDDTREQIRAIQDGRERVLAAVSTVGDSAIISLRGLPPLAFDGPDYLGSFLRLFRTARVTGGAVMGVEQQPITGGPAVVLPGDPAPQASLAYTGAPEYIATVRTYQKVSEELFEDGGPAVVALITDTPRTQFPAAVETEVLDGPGGQGHILGLLRRPGVPATLPAGATAVASVLAALGALTARTRVAADAIVVNGAGWQALLTDTGGVWGDPLPPLFMSPGVPAGTALVGRFHDVGLLLDRQANVEAQIVKDHADGFVSNTLAIRYFARVGFTALRPDLVQPVALPA